MPQNNVTGAQWEELSPEKKKRELYQRQKELLDLFLEKKAITKAQHDRSLSDLTEKMGYGDCSARNIGEDSK